MEVSLSGYKVVYGDKVLNALSLIMMRLKHPERQEDGRLRQRSVDQV